MAGSSQLPSLLPVPAVSHTLLQLSIVHVQGRRHELARLRQNLREEEQPLARKNSGLQAVHVLHECSTFTADAVAEAWRHCHQQRRRVVSAALTYQLAGHYFRAPAAALVPASFGAALHAHVVLPAHPQNPNLCSILLVTKQTLMCKCMNSGSPSNLCVT